MSSVGNIGRMVSQKSLTHLPDYTMQENPRTNTNVTILMCILYALDYVGHSHEVIRSDY